MENILISVIIPVYNVEKYLEKCMDSVIDQRLGEYHNKIEIILVNDGSTDNSLSIIKEYASKDSRIKVIDKQNGGLSDARNVALDRAVGTYIMFLDSDDWWDKDCLNTIINKINTSSDLDVIIGGYKRINRQGEEYSLGSLDFNYINNGTKTDVIKYMLEKSPIPLFGVWKYVIKKDVIDRYHIRFIKGMLCEDMDFTMQILLHSQKYGAIKDNFYCYRCEREGSIMNTFSIKRAEDMLKNINKWEKELLHYEQGEELRVAFCNKCSEDFVNQFYDIIMLKGLQKRQLRDLLANNMMFITDTTNDSMKELRILLRLVNTQTTLYIYEYYIRLRRILGKIKRILRK